MTLNKFKIDEVKVCLSVCLCTVCLCVSLANDSSETIEVIIKLGMVAASDMLIHHVLIILTLTFIQGHTDLNQENNTRSIFSRHCSRHLHVCCQDSPTKGLYNLFSVR